MQINTMGLVLRAVRVGEADQILTVLTPGNGVLSASARGSLRLKNKLFSACGLFCYSEFAITLGRKTNFIDSAAVSKVFHGLSKTVEGTALAAYLSELTITLAPEPPESADCLRLLLNTLYMTAEQKRPLRQLKAIYKDNADTIVGNMDSQIFLGGSEPTTLKDLAEALGKETIDSYNNSDTRGNSPSYGTNYQKLGHDMPYLFVKSSVALNFT